MMALTLWPVAASQYATKVDWLFFAYSAVIALLTLPVFILITVFAIRYRRGRKVDRTHPINRSVLIETSWAVIPFLLTIGFFAYSTELFMDFGHPPADALVINVVAKQWMWKFDHPGGQREIDELHVPAGRPVELVMTSRDVIHSLYLPALRIKEDAVPGRYTNLWFNADRPGIYPLRCAEFCGFDHSRMGGRLVVMRPEAYAAWLETARSRLPDAEEAGR